MIQMFLSGFCILCLLLTVFPVTDGNAADDSAGAAHKDWRVSAGAGLILAPSFTGARDYSFFAVPDIRVAYKDRFFANVRDGIGYAVVREEGLYIGPVVSYDFSRTEKNGGSVFQLAGGRNNGLQGMGDVPGTVSLGVFAEYNLQPYKFKLQVNKGVTGHEGVLAEAKVLYGGVLTYNGPPLIYAFGPHVKYGNQTYTNAYWGVSPEQSARSGLEQYHANAGIISYGVGGFALLPVTKTISVSLFAGYDRLAPPVSNSPLVKVRGSENQAATGVTVNYGF
jgi:outer membrane protein